MMESSNMNSSSINGNSPAILSLTMLSSSLTAGREEPCSTSTSLVKLTAARKKRTKFLHITTSPGGGVSNPTTRKPDPAAPKITMPCTVCGKKFWSWKALFGHMRCHPERLWRGINPPTNLIPRRPNYIGDSSAVTEEDHEVANSLLLLANGASCCDAVDQEHSPSSEQTPQECNCDCHQYYNYRGGAPAAATAATTGFNVDSDNITNRNATNCREFECSSCKKVFGSHQGLGGHRASHKNVKGCYAITKNIYKRHQCSTGGDNAILVPPPAGGHHQCSICKRVFSSGQALGGHKRSHWEKTSIQQGEEDGFNLNFPAALDNDHAASSYSSIDSYLQNPIKLDLSLRL